MLSVRGGCKSKRKLNAEQFLIKQGLSIQHAERGTAHGEKTMLQCINTNNQM